MTIIRKGFADVFEFSRAGSATYWGADGKLHTAGPDEPRFHYDPVTGEALGLLVEGQATNWMTSSTNRSYLTYNAGAVSLGHPGLYSQSSAALIERFGGGTWGGVRIYAGGLFSLSGLPSFLNIAVKPLDGTDTFAIWLGGGSTNARFDLTEVRVITFSSSFFNPSIRSLKDGWCLISVGLAEEAENLYFIPNGVTTNISGSVYLDLPQLSSEHPSSFIPTAGSPVTRPADILTRTLQTPEYNPSEGTMLLRANTKSETIYLDGLSPNGIEATDGEGTLVYTYNEDGGLVYAPNTEYGDDGPPENPELDVAQGNADLRLLAYYPRKFTPEEARLNAQGTMAVTEWDPSFLFKNGEVGVWFDPSDLDTVFQDADGATPGELGQPVGLILDKSQGLELGPNIAPSINDSSEWDAVGSEWTLGTAGATKSPGATSRIRKENSVIGGRTYRYRVTISAYAGGDVRLVLGDSSSINGNHVGTFTAAGTYEGYLQARDVDGELNLRGSSAADLTISELVLQELPGHHASQPTTTARPILGREPKSGRTNMLDWSEDFSQWASADMSVTSVSDPIYGEVSLLSSTDASSFSYIHTNNAYPQDDGPVTLNIIAKPIEGTGSFFVWNRSSVGPSLRGIRISLATFDIVSVDEGSGEVIDYGFTDLEGGWRHFWFSFNTYSDVENGFYLRHPDTANVDVCYLARAWVNKGATPAPYQKTQANGYDVTEEGVDDVYYLAFDGVDDFLIAETYTGLGADGVSATVATALEVTSSQTGYVWTASDTDSSSGVTGVYYGSANRIYTRLRYDPNTPLSQVQYPYTPVDGVLVSVVSYGLTGGYTSGANEEYTIETGVANRNRNFRIGSRGSSDAPGAIYLAGKIYELFSKKEYSSKQVSRTIYDYFSKRLPNVIGGD